MPLFFQPNDRLLGSSEHPAWRAGALPLVGRLSYHINGTAPPW